MNKALLIITLLFTLFGVAPAQSSGNPLPVTVVMPSNEKFVVEMPAVPKLNVDDGSSRRYSLAAENTFFFIFSDFLNKPTYTKKVVKFFKDNKASENSAVIGNVAGETFDFVDAEGFHHKILTIKVKSRSYVFQTVSAIENNPIVERFFASITFDKKLLQEFPAGKEKNKTVPDSPDNNENKMSDAGSGRGSGSGDGINNNANQTTSPSLVNQTSALKIISKPRPEYTDWARFYYLGGIITLRVTFLASGKIGDVSPVSKLPFGLTNNAVNAARGIKFQPATKEGVPYAVSKLIQYSFYVY